MFATIRRRIFFINFFFNLYIEINNINKLQAKINLFVLIISAELIL